MSRPASVRDARTYRTDRSDRRATQPLACGVQLEPVLQFGRGRALRERMEEEVVRVGEVLDADRRGPVLVDVVVHARIPGHEAFEALIGVADRSELSIVA